MSYCSIVDIETLFTEKRAKFKIGDTEEDTMDTTSAEKFISEAEVFINATLRPFVPINTLPFSDDEVPETIRWATANETCYLIIGSQYYGQSFLDSDTKLVIIFDKVKNNLLNLYIKNLKAGVNETGYSGITSAPKYSNPDLSIDTTIMPKYNKKGYDQDEL